MGAKEPISVTPFKNGKRVPCLRCDGTGIDFLGNECETCNGTGEVNRLVEGTVKIYQIEKK